MSTPNLSALVAELKEISEAESQWSWEFRLRSQIGRIASDLAALQPDREWAEKNEKLAAKLDGLPQLLKDGFGVEVGENEVWMREAAAALRAPAQPETGDEARAEKNRELARRLEGAAGVGKVAYEREGFFGLLLEAAVALRSSSNAGLDANNGPLGSALEGMVSLFPERPADDGTPGIPWANHVTEKYDAAVRALKECNAASPAPAVAGEEEFAKVYDELMDLERDCELSGAFATADLICRTRGLLSQPSPSAPDSSASPGADDMATAAEFLAEETRDMYGPVQVACARVANWLRGVPAPAAPSAPVRIDPERPETWPPRDNSILDWPISIMVRAAYHQHGSWVEQNIRWDYELKHWQGGWPATHWQPLPEWPKEGER